MCPARKPHMKRVPRFSEARADAKVLRLRWIKKLAAQSPGYLRSQTGRFCQHTGEAMP
jgi:hypothetical protein